MNPNLRLAESGKIIEVFTRDKESPAIYLNTFESEGEKIYQILENKGIKLTLISIGGLDWNHDMAPWDAPRIWKDDSPFTSGADSYIELLTTEIIPKIEKDLSLKPIWRGLAGYSLAGLFALYSIYKTDAFQRIASASGSLWFPDFLKYSKTHELTIKPERVYLSLGDTESHTKNQYLKTVEENTRELYEYYKSLQIETLFTLNPGNHFKDPEDRMANGISWLLKN